MRATAGHLRVAPTSQSLRCHLIHVDQPRRFPHQVCEAELVSVFEPLLQIRDRQPEEHLRALFVLGLVEGQDGAG